MLLTVMPTGGFDAAKFSARVKLHAGRHQAFQIRAELRRLFKEKFDPTTLAPLPTLAEEIGPPEVHLKRKPDPCPYSWLLRTDYMRPKVLEAWQAVKSGTSRSEHAIRDLMNLVAKTHYDLGNATHRITREGEKIYRAKRRAKVASALLGKASISVRATTQVFTGERICPPSELFEMSPDALLDEVWGWNRQTTPNRYFDVPDETQIGRRANDCVAILDAVGKSELEPRLRGLGRRQAVSIYLEAVQYGAVDPMADVPILHRDLCASIDVACPQWPEDEPGGISQNDLLKMLTGATRGKRQKRIIELIRAFLALELLQRKGKGRTACLILGPGPNGKRCPD